MTAPIIWESANPLIASKVSVLMAAYNAAEFISTSIESVRSQTFENWELLVVDDASNDNTCSVVAAYAAIDCRIKLISLKKNGGPALARNAALDVATGDWISILDADDKFLPTRLEKLLYIASKNALDMLADNIFIIDPDVNRIIRTAFPQDGKFRDLSLLSLFQNNLPASGFTYGLLKPIVKLEFLRKHGISYAPHLRFAEDFVFYSEILKKGALSGIVSTPLYIYTLPISERKGSLSKRSRTPMRTAFLIQGFDHIDGVMGLDLSRSERDALARCRNYINHRDDAALFKSTVRRMNFFNASLLLYQNPFIFMYIFRGLIWRILAAFRNYV
jgi:succinoglycan biosynthesis protein ExoO